jgi:hypothetical protein
VEPKAPGDCPSASRIPWTRSSSMTPVHSIAGMHGAACGPGADRPRLRLPHAAGDEVTRYRSPQQASTSRLPTDQDDEADDSLLSVPLAPTLTFSRCTVFRRVAGQSDTAPAAPR